MEYAGSYNLSHYRPNKASHVHKQYTEHNSYCIVGIFKEGGLAAISTKISSSKFAD